MAPVIAEVSKCFRLNLLLMKMKKVVLGKPYNYADFDFAMCFLIGGRLMLDYDGNMALLKVNSTVQNSALQSPWASRLPPALMQV